MDFAIKISGALLEGQAPGIIGEALDEVEHSLGQFALGEVQMLLDRSIRHPTPYYETQIIAQPLRGDVIVHDRGIIYGPWLEGVSRRNATTRFKGYASFRRARQELERRAPEIAERTMRRFIDRLAG